jgi:hypothetical protein
LIPPTGEHPHLVLCGVSSELQLHGIAHRLSRLAIAHRTFHEPDLGGQLTAACTQPLCGLERQPLRRYGCLKLTSFHPQGQTR